MSIWQGDPPAPVLHRVIKGSYTWTPAPDIEYLIDQDEEDPLIWYVTFPDGLWDDQCRSLGEARQRIGRHYADRWGGPQ